MNCHWTLDFGLGSAFEFQESMELLPQKALTLLPSHLSASEKNPTAKTNFHLKLINPLLARLESCTNMHQLQQLHAQMITTGLIHETFAASRLIAFSAFSLRGDLSYAFKLFNHIRSRNLFIWNAMIRAFCRSNYPEHSLSFYVEMLRFGCVPDSYTFPFLLKACSHLSAFGEGQQVHSHVLKTGLWSDSFVANSLIRMYAELGSVELAELVFEKMPERNEISWATMIGGFVNKDRPDEALALFCSKNWRKTKIDQITLATVLSACAKRRDLKLGKEIHAYIKEEDVGMNLILCNSLMNMYAKCGCPGVARILFDEMLDTDLISWNILISGYSEKGYLRESLELFSEMKARNIRADEATFLSLISACTELDVGLVIHSHAREMGFESSVTICNALIDMYSRIGSVEIGREVFNEMCIRDIVSWNSMIAGYAQSGSMEIAHFLFDQMPEKDNCSWSTMIIGYVREGLTDKAIELYKDLLAEGSIKPDKVTILCALTSCSHLGSLEEGKSIHLYLEKNTTQIDTVLSTSLIDMYVKCGCLEKAVEVFSGLSEKDVFAWTALISGLALHGHGEEALVAFRQMQSLRDRSVKPNSVTFLGVLSACAHAGLVEDGWRIYRSMSSDYGIEPETKHNGCMVDLLGRAGLLDEAVKFIESLGSEIDVCLWGALLGASRIHGNLELGEFATRKVLELEPMHDGAHVLMANIYAEVGRWNDSKGIRRKMKEEDILKRVGRSWIDVNGTRHEFTAGDVLYVESDGREGEI